MCAGCVASQPSNRRLARPGSSSPTRASPSAPHSVQRGPFASHPYIPLAGFFPLRTSELGSDHEGALRGEAPLGCERHVQRTEAGRG